MINRNLLYCSVFYNKDYFKLLDLLLKSMIMFSNYDTFDILIMTQTDFLPFVRDLENNLNIKLLTFCIPCTTIFEAACARLSIFDYPNIYQYEKLLYLDTDIIIKQDISPIFDLDIDELLYAIESGTIQSPSFGVQFFDFTSINPTITGINSGTLLFRHCEPVRLLFSRIKEHIDEYTKAAKVIPYCMDQPFINYHAIKDKLYNNQVLNKHISLYEGDDIVNNYKTSSICHFSYPIGNFGHKYYRMANFFFKLLIERSDTPTSVNILNKKYSWGDQGYILFLNDTLQTPWSTNGKYDIIRPNCVEAYWNNHYHILKFNKDYTGYISIRTHPMDFYFTVGNQYIDEEAPIQVIKNIDEKDGILEYDDTVTIISGLVESIYIDYLIDAYKYIKHKILSTYSDTDSKILDIFKTNGFIVVLSDPLPDEENKICLGTARQVNHIQNGIKKALELGYKYVCRSRTDIFPQSHRKFLYLTRDLYKEKITSLCGIYLENFAYYLDIIVCGTIENISHLFNKKQSLSYNKNSELWFLENYCNHPIDSEDDVKKYINFVADISRDNDIEIIWYKPNTKYFYSTSAPFVKLIKDYSIDIFAYY